MLLQIQNPAYRSAFFCIFDKNRIMDIQTSKIELVKLILDSDNSEFIQKVADFVKKEKSDFWNDLSLSQQNDIKKGIEDLENGKRIEFSEFLKKIS